VTQPFFYPHGPYRNMGRLGTCFAERSVCTTKFPCLRSYDSYKKNSDYFLIQHSLICPCNGNTHYSLWVMNWTFIQDNAKGYVQ